MGFVQVENALVLFNFSHISYVNLSLFSCSINNQMKS